MNIDLTNKHAVVCGSTQGIGKAIAIELAALGASVTLIARNEAALKSVKEELDSSKGQRHDYICADFSWPSDLELQVKRYAKGREDIHILVNNTGGPQGGPLLNARPEDFTQTFSNHLICNHMLVQAFVEGMKKSGYGRIINVISTSVKEPIQGLGVSNTIRASVANWAKTLSFELGAHGITVNNVLPGATNTARLTSLLEAKSKTTGKSVEQLKQAMLDEIPAGRFAEAAEVANAVAFLASPAAGYINGINITVDGGRMKCY